MGDGLSPSLGADVRPACENPMASLAPGCPQVRAHGDATVVNDPELPRVQSVEQKRMLVGGGPRAFQKYESGDLLPSHAISSPLVLLDQHLEAFGLSHGKAKQVSSYLVRSPMTPTRIDTRRSSDCLPGLSLYPD